MKVKKRLLSILIIIALILPMILLPSTSVQADEWEECVYCGKARSEDWLCDSCGGCGIESNNNCFLEHHCPCGACDLEIPICDNCRQCLDCVSGDVMCVDCGMCEDCAGKICEECPKCLQCVGFDEYCTSCDKCAVCMGMGFCYECEFCGDCTTMCSNDDCPFCEECSGQVCDSCGQCAFCVFDLFCDNCGLCNDCSGPICQGCNYCSDCETVCIGCGDCCSQCGEVCSTCEECVNLCEDCGVVCEGCAKFCQECDKCENCVNLCSNCGKNCDNCLTFCQGCNACSDCGNICPSCGEFCDMCQEHWAYKSLDDIQHRWQCSCGSFVWKAESHTFQYEVSKPATATEVGIGQLKCRYCDYKKNIPIPAIGDEAHIHEFSLWVPMTASYHEKYCVCGKNDPSSKGNHELKWVIDTEATIENSGLKHQECIICSFQLPGETIPPIEHTHAYGTTWYFTDQTHWHACACGHNSEEKAHSMGEWIVTLAATETVQGSEECECSVCDYKQVRVIPLVALDFTVTFDCNGGSTVPAQSVRNGDKVIKPENPSRTGYVFTGWYTTPIGTTSWNFEQLIYEPATLYAQWVLEEKTVSGGGSSGAGVSSLVMTYTINTNTGIGGNIDTAQVVNVAAGGSKRFNIMPKEGYAINDVQIDGKSVGVVSFYVFTNIRSNHTISATFKKIEDTSSDTWGYAFTDVQKNEWYYEPVMKACEKGWFAGTSVTTFSPNAAMTRGMLVTVLWRIEGEQIAKTHNFHDVAPDMYYNTGVAWAVEQGIVKGYGKNIFGPEDNITREQLAAMLYNYARYKGSDLGARGDLSKFVDGNETSAYALNAIKWALGSGLINGKDDDILDPIGNSTRSEVATMLMRFLEK